MDTNDNLQAITKGLENYLSKNLTKTEILQVLNNLDNQFKSDQKQVEITTSVTLSEEEKTNFQQFLNEKYLSEKIDIKYQVDKSIVGGFKIKFNDDLIDQSFKTTLNNLSSQLLK